MDDETRKRCIAMQRYVRCHDDARIIIVSEWLYSQYDIDFEHVEIWCGEFVDDDEFICIHDKNNDKVNDEDYYVYYKDWYIDNTSITTPTPPPPSAWCEDTN